MTKCTYGNCNRNSKYALYELLESALLVYGCGLKRWRTDLCVKHWEFIFKNNESLKMEYPNAKWQDIDKTQSKVKNHQNTSIIDGRNLKK